MWWWFLGEFCVLEKMNYHVKKYFLNFGEMIYKCQVFRNKYRPLFPVSFFSEFLLYFWVAWEVYHHRTNHYRTNHRRTNHRRTNHHQTIHHRTNHHGKSQHFKHLRESLESLYCSVNWAWAAEKLRHTHAYHRAEKRQLAPICIRYHFHLTRYRRQQLD